MRVLFSSAYEYVSRKRLGTAALNNSFRFNNRCSVLILEWCARLCCVRIDEWVRLFLGSCSVKRFANNNFHETRQGDLKSFAEKKIFFFRLVASFTVTRTKHTSLMPYNSWLLYLCRTKRELHAWVYSR